MLKILSTFFGAALLLLACQSEPNDVQPVELRASTWVRQSGTFRLGENWARTERFYNQYPLVVAFDSSGKVLYGADKQLAGCCAPYSYRANRASLQFFYNNPNPDPLCAQLNCILSELTADVTWEIETLTSDVLVVKTDKQRIVFKAQ